MAQNKSCHFALSLPDLSLAEYQKLPIEPSTWAASRLTLPKLKHHLFPVKVEQEEEDLCHCGLQPVIHIIKASGPSFERKFTSCIIKEEDQCEPIIHVKVKP